MNHSTKFSIKILVALLLGAIAYITSFEGTVLASLGIIIANQFMNGK